MTESVILIPKDADPRCLRLYIATPYILIVRFLLPNSSHCAVAGAYLNVLHSSKDIVVSPIATLRCALYRMPCVGTFHRL